MKIAILFQVLIIIGLFSSRAQNTWVQKSDLGYDTFDTPEPTARSGAAGFSIGSKGYVGTGSATNDFWEFDPNENTWTQKADFGGTSRNGAVGFSIGSKGYLGTGTSDNPPYAAKDFWEFDPVANAWTQKADFGGTARTNAVGFSIGNKGYLGTGSSYDNGYIYYKDFWEYSQSADTWTQKADFGGTVRNQAVGFNISSKGYIGTGYFSDAVAHYYKDFWEYNTVNNTWTQKADFGGFPRKGAVGFGIGNKGYLGTGFGKDFWEYDPLGNTWQQKADFGGTATQGAIGFSIGSKGYIGTGSDDILYTVCRDFWEYDTDVNIWTQKADFGGTTRYGAIGFTIGSKGYIGTGYDNGGYFKDFWEFDAASNAWTQKADFGGGNRQHATGFSIGSKGYIGTGFDGYSPRQDFWEYDPNTNIWTQKADFGGGVRSHAVGFGIGSKGYLGTGMIFTVYYGGYFNIYSFNDFWEYDRDLDTWINKADFGGSPRSSAVGFNIESKGYIGTGVDADSYDYYKDFWEYDPQADVWTIKADFGGGVRTDAAGFSIGNNGYLGTGYIYDLGYINYKDFWEYNPVADTWIQKADFGGSGRYSATGFSIANKGYIGTGADANSYDYYKDFWEYTPDGVVTCNIPTSLSAVNITSTTANLKWDAMSGAIGYKVMYKSSDAPQWTFTSSAYNHKIITALTANTNYVWKVKSVCSSSPLVSSDGSERARFITAPLRLAAGYETMFEVYPNPVSQSATVTFLLNETSPVVMEIMDIQQNSYSITIFFIATPWLVLSCKK